MRHRRKQGLTGDLIDLLMELSSFSWKIDAVISALFWIASISAFKWALTVQQTNNTMLKSVLDGGLIWVYYFISLGLLGIAIILGWKAYKKYTRASYY